MYLFIIALDSLDCFSPARTTTTPIGLRRWAAYLVEKQCSPPLQIQPGSALFHRLDTLRPFRRLRRQKILSNGFHDTLLGGMPSEASSM